MCDIQHILVHCSWGGFAEFTTLRNGPMEGQVFWRKCRGLEGEEELEESFGWITKESDNEEFS